MFDIRSRTHEIKKVLISEQIKSRIFVSDSGEVSIYFSVKLLELFFYLSEVTVHDNIFANKNNGVIDIVTLDQLPVHINQIIK